MPIGSHPRPHIAWFPTAGILLFAATMLTIVTTLVIWPGELKLSAPLFCTDAQPDAFVVSDTYRVQPGETTTNYTMYCMGPRGDVTDVGFFGPFVATIALHMILIAVIVAALLRVDRIRRRPVPRETVLSSRHGID